MTIGSWFRTGSRTTGNRFYGSEVQSTEPRTGTGTARDAGHADCVPENLERPGVALGAHPLAVFEGPDTAAGASASARCDGSKNRCGTRKTSRIQRTGRNANRLTSENAGLQRSSGVPRCLTLRCLERPARRSASALSAPAAPQAAPSPQSLATRRVGPPSRLPVTHRS
jgi:hypothetical protein